MYTLWYKVATGVSQVRVGVEQSRKGRGLAVQEVIGLICVAALSWKNAINATPCLRFRMPNVFYTALVQVVRADGIHVLFAPFVNVPITIFAKTLEPNFGWKILRVALMELRAREDGDTGGSNKSDYAINPKSHFGPSDFQLGPADPGPDPGLNMPYVLFDFFLPSWTMFFNTRKQKGQYIQFYTVQWEPHLRTGIERKGPRCKWVLV